MSTKESLFQVHSFLILNKQKKQRRPETNCRFKVSLFFEDNDKNNIIIAKIKCLIF